MKYTSIAKEIIRLKNADIELRNRLVRNGELQASYHHQMQDLHNKNAEILDEIISHIGYPTADKVGEEAAEAAWLVIQHAIARPDFMRKCLVLLENSASKNKRERISMVYLADRIAVFEDRPQLYGTQFDWDENGHLSPNLCDHPDQVNERRAALGLKLLEEQTQIIRDRALKENRPPPEDLKQKNKEMQAWKKSVGWIS